MQARAWWTSSTSRPLVVDLVVNHPAVAGAAAIIGRDDRIALPEQLAYDMQRRQTEARMNATVRKHDRRMLRRAVNALGAKVHAAMISRLPALRGRVRPAVRWKARVLDVVDCGEGGEREVPPDGVELALDFVNPVRKCRGLRGCGWPRRGLGHGRLRAQQRSGAL